jgi:predicted AlkP superfamily pyrophosphatase or phosphodiesterase
MVTGKTPKYTGIHNREKKPLTVPTIFDVAAEKGKTSKLIEGNMRIIIDEVQTVLNIDENKNGTIDDEIYNCAMKEMEKPPHILMIHFHSYDDFGHKYGPSSDEALKQLGVLDSYIENIVEKYSGDVIITSDHGMHSVEEGGEHGTFSPLDMFIPIIDNN